MKEFVEFTRRKSYKLIKALTPGAIGEIVLLHDEEIDKNFVCKKYSPSPLIENKLEYFTHFKDEIKILHQLHHKNIVQIFTYYLYPEFNTGYILMEYIEGEELLTYLSNNPNEIVNIFNQLIDAFAYIHQYKILHRDIKNNNILVDKFGQAKIIDFGFGKKIQFDDFDRSISLATTCPPPEEFKSKKYDYSTEIYFVGQLFKQFLESNTNHTFPYSEILSKMCSTSPIKRFNSFFDIQRAILDHGKSEFNFTDSQISIYRTFANIITSITSKIHINATYVNDIDLIINKLEKCYQNSILEEHIHAFESIISCFISGVYKYKIKREVATKDLKNFIEMMKLLPIEKKKIVINNLWQRFDCVQRYTIDDDLPF